MDKKELAEFLRRRRETLRPRDVGLVESPRRRTQGLRREEVAALTGMSTDQQIPLERAFAAPYKLTRRLGHDLDAEEMASRRP